MQKLTFFTILTDLQQGLVLMAVGMITVFLILLIVIYGSQLLVNLVNRIAPEEEKAVKEYTSEAAPASVKSVLDAAVAQLSGGKGHITKVIQI